MALTVQAGDTLGTLARRAGVTRAELRQANPGLDPSRLEVGQPLNLPGARDEFTRARKHDASAQRALRELELHAGPTISARELRRAIDRGTADFDGSMAGREYRDFAQWAKAHAAQLTDGAKEVMALYAGAAKAANADGEAGVSPADRARLLHRMALVNGSSGATSTATPAGSSPGSQSPAQPRTARQWQAAALEDPARIFKRQVRDPRWNRDPDAPRRSGHCAIATLAMAVEAFGLEKKGLDTRNHSRDQDTIDAVARQMPRKFMIEKNGGNTWLTDLGNGKTAIGTNASQVGVAAGRMGLERAQHRNISMQAIDAALAKGHMVCLGGEAGAKFRAAQGHSYAEGHSVLIMGKTADGRYLVCDPLSRKGPTRLTREQLASFDTRGYTSTEVWRG